MADHSHRTHFRDGRGPQAVHSHEKSRGSSRRQRDGEGREQERPKRSSPPKSSKSTPSKSGPERKQRLSVSSPKPVSSRVERPVFELDVMEQPSKVVPLGMDVQTSIMVSLRYSCPENVYTGGDFDTSRLFAVASLVEETSRGEREPMENGSMTGQKLFDSVHDLPDDYARAMQRRSPSRLALGYFSFSGLLIRQSGYYRIRISLVQMAGSGSTSPGATTLSTTDSELLKVERPQSHVHRRDQRMYS